MRTAVPGARLRPNHKAARPKAMNSTPDKKSLLSNRFNDASPYTLILLRNFGPNGPTSPAPQITTVQPVSPSGKLAPDQTRPGWREWRMFSPPVHPLREQIADEPAIRPRVRRNTRTLTYPERRNRFSLMRREPTTGRLCH